MCLPKPDILTYPHTSKYRVNLMPCHSFLDPLKISVQFCSNNYFICLVHTNIYIFPRVSTVTWAYMEHLLCYIWPPIKGLNPIFDSNLWRLCKSHYRDWNDKHFYKRNTGFIGSCNATYHCSAEYGPIKYSKDHFVLATGKLCIVFFSIEDYYLTQCFHQHEHHFD